MDYTAMSAQPLRRQTLVLVTDQFQCERIIKAGRAIAGITHTQLRVFHICAEGRTSVPLPCSTSTIRQRRTGPCWKSPITAILWAAITETLESTNTVNVITGQPGGRGFRPLYPDGTASRGSSSLPSTQTASGHGKHRPCGRVISPGPDHQTKRIYPAGSSARFFIA